MKIATGLCLSLLLGAASASFGATRDDDFEVCFTARLRAEMPNGETVIVESNEIGKTFEEANELGLKDCKKSYPEAVCTIAGHAIVDCPEAL